jgi:membrane associated rhomboid family serine protease
MNQITPIVKQLLIINGLFFLGTFALGDQAYHFLSLFYPESPNFKAWQIFTHMFMHGGFLHLFFNMIGLYSFGTTLEYIWGGKKLLFFYISCGVGAALLHMLFGYYQFHHGLNILLENNFKKAEILNLLNTGQIDSRWTELLGSSGLNDFASAYVTPIVGASGAIYGLTVAFAMLFPNAELGLMFIPVPIKAKYFVPGLLLIDLYLGFNGNSLFGAGGSGVAHFAHLGGALFGFIITWFWNKDQANHNRWN